MWCLLVHDKYVKLLLSQRKVWEIRTQKLFKEGEKIAIGNTKTKLVEGYAVVSDIKKMTVPEMLKYNDQHFANDFIIERWGNREALYAFVLSNVTENTFKRPYPPSHGSPKVLLKEDLLINA